MAHLIEQFSRNFWIEENDAGKRTSVVRFTHLGEGPAQKPSPTLDEPRALLQKFQISPVPSRDQDPLG